MASKRLDWAAIGRLLLWIESKPAPLGNWFTPNMVVASYPERTNLMEVDKALTKLAQRDVVVKCSAPPKYWYVWKSTIDTALEGE